MQLIIIVLAILLWLTHFTQQTTLSYRQYRQREEIPIIVPPQDIDSNPKTPKDKELSTQGEEEDAVVASGGGGEVNHRSKRLSENRPAAYRNPFSTFLKRKRHSKSTESRLILRKEYTNGDSKCGLMCHLLCRPGCSKICYSSCT
ncbi:unnamed protein product [Trichobilharzia szidati]|nr:unnamed protein product [Trichobilharzia szidati]